MLFEPLFLHATRDPQHVAIIDDQGNYTYGQLSAMAAGLGMYLAMQTKQDRIGLLLPSGAGFVASFYGALLAGKTVVPINYLLGEREIGHIIGDSGIDTVVTVPFFAGRLTGLTLNVIDLSKLPQSPPAPIEPRFPSPAPDDVAVLLYTSGTSALPKGVLLTYRNLESVVDAGIQHAALQDRHTFLGLIPLFHSLGITAMVLAPVRLGATMIFVARFSPAGTMSVIRTHHPSLIFGVPSMFAALLRLKDASPADFAHIYAIISGGEPLPETVREAFQQRFGVPLYEGYGLTETSAVISLNTPQRHKPGSVGRPIPGVDVRISDDNGGAVPAGQPGEVWLKGPMIMQAYHSLPAETAAALTPDRYFKTGDLGMIDADGFLHITGRKKDLIIVGGEKASPREIEEVLMRHPAVAEAAVLGKKDPGRGEIVVAFVIPREGHTTSADVLRNFAQSAGLAQWKVPREVYIVPDLPRTPTGKVLKRELSQKLDSASP